MLPSLKTLKISEDGITTTEYAVPSPAKNFFNLGLAITPTL